MSGHLPEDVKASLFSQIAPIPVEQLNTHAIKMITRRTKDLLTEKHPDIVKLAEPAENRGSTAGESRSLTSKLVQRTWTKRSLRSSGSYEDKSSNT